MTDPDPRTTAPNRTRGRPPTGRPRQIARCLSLSAADWQRFDALPGASRSAKLRWLLALADLPA